VSKASIAEKALQVGDVLVLLVNKMQATSWGLRDLPQQ
jgi:hypothetical protein